MSTPVKQSPPASDKRIKLSVGHAFKVDRAAGRLSDLSLITANREAKGHGIYIDARTLETAAEVCKEKGGRLKGYRTHDHSGPAGSWYAELGSELDVAGFFSSIAIKGEQLVAGAFEFYDSYKTAEKSKDEYERLIEMAEKTPDLLALSIECWGYVVFVAEDDTEYSQRPEDVELKYEGMPALRVTDLWAAAFCSDGAANDGLFAKLGTKIPAGLRSLAAAFMAGVAQLEETPTKTPAVASPAPSNETPLSPDKSTMKIIESIKAKFGADKAKFSQAMTILGDNPEITIEALEAKMVSESLAAAQAQVTALTTERDNLKRENVTLKTERDDFKGKFEAIQKSGHPGVSLTAPAAPTADANGNPWLLSSLNETEQCRLLKTDPARATALQAQAATANAEAKKKK